ncbi:MAG TPA: hypothetical protein VMW23_05065 [Sedimentisphaerales bacterium]|nr:hypothetical protein [Sedimentisphaerales bacterium]
MAKGIRPVTNARIQNRKGYQIKYKLSNDVERCFGYDNLENPIGESDELKQLSKKVL